MCCVANRNLVPSRWSTFQRYRHQKESLHRRHCGEYFEMIKLIQGKYSICLLRHMTKTLIGPLCCEHLVQTPSLSLHRLWLSMTRKYYSLCQDNSHRDLDKIQDGIVFCLALSNSIAALRASNNALQISTNPLNINIGTASSPKSNQHKHLKKLITDLNCPSQHIDTQSSKPVSDSQRKQFEPSTVCSFTLTTTAKFPKSQSPRRAYVYSLTSGVAQERISTAEETLFCTTTRSSAAPRQRESKSSRESCPR